jgi:WD40 repeat protein/predicted Ser/Thr protein kinase
MFSRSSLSRKADMTKQLACPECGRPLPADAREEVCPACALQSLLKFVTADSKSEPQPSGTDAVPTCSPEPSGRFGDYELVELLARGGMGVVYKARQISLNRTVALKMIQAGLLATPAEVKRFHTEAEAIAQLQHPNIVAVHEIGEHDGRQYFSMDYVAGRTLAEIARDGPLPVTRAAAYVQAIAAAVHYAHQHGILHRDLKPANIIIDDNDDPRITDFGLAKKLNDSAFSTLDSSLTLSGQVLGSPNYLPPEQAEPKRGVLGPPSDVYALGAILYHLVTGRPPFQAESLTTLLRQVIETDPVTPRSLNPGIPRDLETICLKCLEKESRRRHGTAQALADDLERFLKGEPVLARPVGASDKVWRWCLRQPVKAGLVTALIVVMAAGVAGVVWQWRQAQANAAAEQRQRQAAVAGEYAANIALAQSLIQANQFGLAREALLTRTQESYRGWEWGWLLRSCNQDLMTLSDNPSLGGEAFFSPDSRELVTSGAFSSVVQIWNLQTGQATGQLLGHAGMATMTPFTPDGRHLGTFDWSGAHPKLQLWNMQTFQRVYSMGQPGGGVLAALSADGRLLATGCDDGKVRVFDALSGASTGLTNDYGDAVLCVAFSPVARRIAYAGGSWHWTRSQDRTVCIWDLTAGETKRLPGHEQSVWGLAWSPDGTLLVSCGSEGKIKAWDPESGKELQPFEASPKQRLVFRANFSPDGQWLGAVGADLPNPTARATLFRVRTRRISRELAGHSTMPQGISFSPDGRYIATSATLERTVKIWSAVELPAFISLEGHEQEVCTAAFSPDGQHVATGGLDQTARIWNTTNGTLRRTIVVGFPVVSLAYSPDGGRLVTVGPDNTASIWEVPNPVAPTLPTSAATDKEALSLCGHTRAVLAVAWSTNGQWIATGSKDKTAKMWDAATGKERQTLIGHQGPVQAVAFSPDGNRLATASGDGTARLWAAASGQCLQVLTNHTAPVLSIAFSPDGKWLATGSADCSACLWDTASGRLVHRLAGHINGVSSLAFSPDGQRLLTAASGTYLYANFAREFRVLIWDVASGRQLLTLPAHDNTVHAAIFSPDGRRLVTASGDHTARIWTAFPWRSTEYGGDTNISLATRVEAFKRQYWRAAMSNHLAAATIARPWTNGFHIDKHQFGDLDLPPAGSKTRPLRMIPLRPPQVSSNQIDLTGLYNLALNESWQPMSALADLARNLSALPAGLGTFAGVPFDVRGLIQLRGASPDAELYPKQRTILVNRRFQRLHALHGTTWLEWQGRPIGAFVLHYANGQQADLPIAFGEHLRGEDPRLDPESEVSDGRLVWGAKTPSDPMDNRPRLYQATFVNPNPDLEVLAIDYVSRVTRCGPFLIALTVE